MIPTNLFINRLPQTVTLKVVALLIDMIDFISDSLPLGEHPALSANSLDIAIELDRALQCIYKDKIILYRSELSLYSKFSHQFYELVESFYLFCMLHFGKKYY